MKRGFTLVELMTTVTVFSLILGGIVSASVGLFRMYRRAMAEAELAIDVHRIREHLLFKILPESGSHLGLLGLKVDSVDATAINAQDYRIVQDGGYLAVEGIASSRDWLNPNGFNPCGGWTDIVFPVADPANLSKYRKLFIDISLSHDGVTQGERIVVPQFGMIQNPPKGDNANGIEKQP